MYVFVRASVFYLCGRKYLWSEQNQAELRGSVLAFVCEGVCVCFYLWLAYICRAYETKPSLRLRVSVCVYLWLTYICGALKYVLTYTAGTSNTL